MPGEVIGIIGRNGAGKSTLLRVWPASPNPRAVRSIYMGVWELCSKSEPVSIPILRARKYFLNGTILGMKVKEIKRKFDEIVAFSEIERFLETPVKHYSSGMYLRLAFSIAAHFEPEVLLMDEIIAVGDIVFRRSVSQR